VRLERNTDLKKYLLNNPEQDCTRARAELVISMQYPGNSSKGGMRAPRGTMAPTRLGMLLLMCFLSFLAQTTAHGQLFILNDNVAYGGQSYISEYTTSGTLLNGDLADIPDTGPANGGALGMVTSGGDLYVMYGYFGLRGNYYLNISEYSTSGQVLNTSPITLPYGNNLGMAISGTDLYIESDDEGSGAPTYESEVSEYTTTGQPINEYSLVAGLKYRPRKRRCLRNRFVRRK